MLTKYKTKGELLLYLKGRLHDAVVDDLIVFSASDWEKNGRSILERVCSIFSDKQKLLVRSSVVEEDMPTNSLAGCFHSEPCSLTLDGVQLAQAIETVKASYGKNSRMVSSEDEIIVQAQIEKVAYSGVVITREAALDSPYYVINFDDISGLTNMVTQGFVSKALRIATWSEPSSLSPPWNRLIRAIKEIEDIFPEEVMGIEFGIDHEYVIHIFQVRLMGKGENNLGTYEVVQTTVRELQKDFVGVSSVNCDLTGASTILADMADWNPAEIVGSRPNTLDRELYRRLVTKSSWNEARASLGYTNVSPAELMVSIADKPYIDVRVSFNSLTPAGVGPPLKKPLVDYYLDKLAQHPSLQDKIEFEIVFSCYDLNFDDRISDLKNLGLSKDLISDFRKFLLSFTNDLLLRSSELFNIDLYALRKINERVTRNIDKDASIRSLVGEANQLLQVCRDHGVIPFSRLARLAFIGLALLKSILKQGIIGKDFYDKFLNSFETVATKIDKEYSQVIRGEMDADLFLSKYGHLRPGTYNILAPRYDSTLEFFSTDSISKIKKVIEKVPVNDLGSIRKIDSALARNGIDLGGHELMNFIRRAVEYREFAKFEFSKPLSDAIELIAMAGERGGFAREDMAYLDLEAIMLPLSYREIDSDRVIEIWKTIISRNTEKKKIYRRIALPPVIKGEKDLVEVPYYEAYPNFITSRCVEGSSCLLNDANLRNGEDINDKIVLMEHADPGFDWIFTRRPRGLITKYGGVASHIAVRCAEFGLPAAIGCGEILFDHLLSASRISLNCSTGIVTSM